MTFSSIKSFCCSEEPRGCCLIVIIRLSHGSDDSVDQSTDGVCSSYLPVLHRILRTEKCDPNGALLHIFCNMHKFEVEKNGVHYNNNINKTYDLPLPVGLSTLDTNVYSKRNFTQ